MDRRPILNANSDLQIEIEQCILLDLSNDAIRKRYPDKNPDTLERYAARFRRKHGKSLKAGYFTTQNKRNEWELPKKKDEKQIAPIFIPFAEIKRLRARSLPITKIASLLRVSYKAVISVFDAMEVEAIRIEIENARIANGGSAL